MTITDQREGNTLIIQLDGRLDTDSSPELDAFLQEAYEGVDTLIFDFEHLEYISSAGLRVLLTAQKHMSKCGEMKLIHVCEEIMEVFDITGFADVLTIE